MQYIKLGQSDLTVSRLCMGCMGFGDPTTGQHTWTLGEQASREIIRYGLENGINFYDTAIAYQHGSSERYLGKALRDMAKREDVVVATKFLPRTGQQIADGISGKQAILQSLDQSLHHLGMDYVDLYIYHIWDYNTPILDVLEALHQAVRSGKVRALGISNCYAWQLAKANEIATYENLTPFISVQSHYNLIMREDDTYAKGKYDKTAEQDQVIIRRVAELADRYQVSMTEISLAWLLTKVTAPVVGATKKQQIDDAVHAVDRVLSLDDIQYLEECYQPHRLSGIMAQNTVRTKDQKQVWTR